MSGISKPVFFSGMGLSFAIGFGLAWQLLPTTPMPLQLAADTARTASSANNSAAGMNQFGALWGHAGADPNLSAKPTMDELWAQSKTAKGSHQLTTEMQTQMREAAQSDPAALRKLLQRFDAERDPKARETLRTVLSSIQSPEVLALSTRLTTSSDPAQRQEGFAMLMQLSPDSPEVRNLVKQALTSEQSPAVLSQAVAALTPTVVASAEAEGIVSQLNQLTQHADPSVRSQSILQLAQWDKSGQLEGRLSQALQDQTPEVRNAAVAAVGESGIRTSGMKAALMSMLANPNENMQVKDNALHALERFSLSKDEYALYSRERTEADKRFKE
ncbi:MAG: HEAT repeat domain-containing protein [Proteobacteria bacterium]|nr:HEAT repeat domain-containing protein [Pseudomonadota bacterium]